MNHEIPKGGKMASIGVRRGTDSENLTNYLIVILSSRCQIDRITTPPVDAHLIIDGDRGNRRMAGMRIISLNGGETVEGRIL